MCVHDGACRLWLRLLTTAYHVDGNSADAHNDDCDYNDDGDDGHDWLRRADRRRSTLSHVFACTKDGRRGASKEAWWHTQAKQ